MQNHQRVVCAECAGFGHNRQTIQVSANKRAPYYAGNDLSKYSDPFGTDRN